MNKNYKDIVRVCTARFSKKDVLTVEEAKKITEDFYGADFVIKVAELKEFYKVKAVRKSYLENKEWKKCRN